LDLDEDVGGRWPTRGREDIGDTAVSTEARQRGTTFPKTTMSVMGWAQSLTPALKNVRQLERHARPCGDIRKTFGWPPDSD